jgi:YegS/Rv2252/BmrU family lipid kinase
MGKAALLLVNRKARRGRSDLTSGLARLERAGFDLIVTPVQGRKEFAREIDLRRREVEAIIIGGGDGTLSASAEALVEAQLPLGILPLGTANDLCRTLGIPHELHAACDVIAAGNTRRIDLGWVNGKHFFNVANIGLAVRVTRRLNRRLKSRWGVLAYLFAATHVLIRARPMTVEIRTREESCRTKTIQITVGNGQYYGGGMSVDQDAKIDDGILNLYSLEVANWWQIIPLLPAMWRGTLGDSSNARLLSGPEFEIRPVRRNHHITTDGEITGRTPAHVRVIPKVISVFAPPADAVVGY